MGMAIDESMLYEMGYNTGFKDGIKGSIPKDQYEARLKADMVAMLTEIQLEIEEKHREEEFMNDWSSGYNSCLIDTSNSIQQKINAIEGKINNE